jgi:cyclopropane fatty-acyl-phospholipid synthase-like methyltransferase
MTKPWEFESERDMLIGLIGYDFGPEPERRLPEIRESKKRMADYIVREAKLRSNDTVLEVGSGCGFLSYWIARVVSRLHCCDVSEAFLAFAQRECKEIPNISFHTIHSMDLDFLSEASVGGIYSHAVFIHLNLYDIFWYFGEFKRVLRPNGRVWLDIANAEDLNPAKEKYFLEMAGYYKENPRALPSLMQWNSASAVEGIARHYGFRTEAIEQGREFLFVHNP